MHNNYGIKQSCTSFDNLTIFKKNLLFVLLLFIGLNGIKTALIYIFVTDISSDHFAGRFVLSIGLSGVFILLYTLYKQRLLLVIFYVVQGLYALMYLSYYTFFHDYFNIFREIILLNEGLELLRSFSIPLTVQMFYILIDMVFLIIFLKYYNDIRNMILLMKVKTFFKKNKITLFSLLITIFTVLVTLQLAIFYNDEPLHKMYLKDDFTISQPDLIIGYGAFVENLIGYFGVSKEKELIQNLKYGEEILSETQKNKNPNFIIIQVESLQSLIPEYIFNNKPIMPFLNKLINKSIYYPFTHTYHMGGATSDTEFAAINSAEPLRSIPIMKIRDYEYPNSFIKILSNLKYETYVFHNNVGSFFNRDIAFKKMGFKHFYFRQQMELPEVHWGATDEAVFNYIEKFLKNENISNNPYFFYIITMSSHEPYKIIPKYFFDPDFDTIKNMNSKNYFTSMRYVDNVLEKFISSIDRSNTYIFIFGDHTAGINSEFIKNPVIYLDGKQFEFIPMFILTPDNKIYMEMDYIASLIDLAPTILYASGVSFSYKSSGIALLSAMKILNNRFKKSTIEFENYRYSRKSIMDIIKNSLFSK